MCQAVLAQMKFFISLQTVFYIKHTISCRETLLLRSVICTIGVYIVHLGLQKVSSTRYSKVVKSTILGIMCLILNTTIFA